jgi:hypothetical protein
VVVGNPDLDNVYTYTKAKHRGETGQGILDVHWQKLRMLFGLRRERYDFVILANLEFSPRPLRLASWIAPRHIVGFVEPGTRWSRVGTLAYYRTMCNASGGGVFGRLRRSALQASRVRQVFPIPKSAIGARNWP